MKLNMIAVAFWVAAGAAGWLVGGTARAAVIGALIAWTLSFVVYIAANIRNS